MQAKINQKLRTTQFLWIMRFDFYDSSTDEMRDSNRLDRTPFRDTSKDLGTGLVLKLIANQKGLEAYARCTPDASSSRQKTETQLLKLIEDCGASRVDV